MALPWRLFLQPTRFSFSTMTSPSSIFRARTPLYEKFQPLKIWIKGFEHELRNHARSPHWKLSMQRCYANNFYKSGMKFCMGSVFYVSVVFGSICLGPRMAYAMNGFNILGNNDHVALQRTTDAEEDPHEGLVLARKLLPPAFLLLTVLMSWGHPTILVAKVILILFVTATIGSPTSFSVQI